MRGSFRGSFRGLTEQDRRRRLAGAQSPNVIPHYGCERAAFALAIDKYKRELLDRSEIT